MKFCDKSIEYNKPIIGGKPSVDFGTISWNISDIISITRKVLSPNRGKEMADRVWKSHNMEEAISIIREYVIIRN